MTRAPSHLSQAQKRIYIDAASKLHGRISESRSHKLEAYAIERDRWLESESYIAQHGKVIIQRNDKGAVIKIIECPQLKISERAQDRAIKLSTDLGL